MLLARFRIVSPSFPNDTLRLRAWPARVPIRRRKQAARSSSAQPIQLQVSVAQGPSVWELPGDMGYGSAMIRKANQRGYQPALPGIERKTLVYGERTPWCPERHR